MKKIIIGMLFTAVALGAHATLDWDSPAIDLSTAPFNMSAGWVAYMYHDVDGDSSSLSVDYQTSWMDFSDGSFSGGDATINDDQIITSFTTSLADSKGVIQWSTSFADGWENTYGGEDVYTIVFNSSDYTTANNYFVFDSNASQAPTLESLGTSPNHSYIAPDSGYWAVPEPATAMLLALGGGLAWLIRLKQRLL